MRHEYYEHLWERERQQREHARLNQALESAFSPSTWQSALTVLGHSLIRAGAWLAGEAVPVIQLPR